MQVKDYTGSVCCCFVDPSSLSFRLWPEGRENSFNRLTVNPDENFSIG